MWLKWLPWKYMVRRAARRQGFIDPIALLARFNAISQPTQTMAPLELLRAGAVLHARGFMNNNVIQHNLDWVWPFWVERQFDPRHPAFIPRAFSMTHINLTQRNWTAIGFPGLRETPVSDARGLLMPFFDSWSLDAWFVADTGEALIPSRMEKTEQRLEMEGNLRVLTESRGEGMRLRTCAEVVVEQGVPVAKFELRAESQKSGWLVASLRPYNPEGVSFVNDLSLLAHAAGWEINKEHAVKFSRPPDEHVLSNYRDGDVYLSIRDHEFNRKSHVRCDVGMATGAAMYRMEAGQENAASLTVELLPPDKKKEPLVFDAAARWREALEQSVPFSGGYRRDNFLYEAGLRTTVLLSPREVLAGPYTYKRFWYRDAVIIIHALMCAGHRKHAEESLDYCVQEQAVTGYFKSQEGEWDSNGQVLWALGRYCRLFDVAPKPEWIAAVRKGVHWIRRKRLTDKSAKRHAGLLPAGFSAEHLGPNDFYYWDDFWTISGLRLGEEMLRQAGDAQTANEAAAEAEALSGAVDRSLAATAEKIRSVAMPASPYRRLDSGAVGSVAAGFPLQLWPPDDPRLLATIGHLYDNCLVDDGFYHDISHSGINPYLTLHIAQCLLRAGDPRFRKLMRAISGLASETGQWPEAIHPRLATGCMGDGQHAWAAAEWIMMIRNCFLFEEEYENKLVLGAGLSSSWCGENGRTSFGPAPTRFGLVTVSLEARDEEAELRWEAQWHGPEPDIEVRFEESGLEPVDGGDGRRLYRRTKTA